TTKLDGLERFLDIFANFDVGNIFLSLGQKHLAIRLLQAGLVGHNQPTAESIVLAGIAIDTDAYIHIFFVALFNGRCQSAFESPEHHFTRDVFLARQCIDQQQNLATHRFLPLKSRTGSSLARSISSNVKCRTWVSPLFSSNSSPKVSTAAPLPAAS